MTYHNTTHETGQTLIDFSNIAENQDEVVLSIFRIFERELTPADVWMTLNGFGYGYLLTSVRRSITNLTKSGHLVHTDIKKPGLHGRPNTTWKCR